MSRVTCRARRATRVRKKVSGTAERPRLAVFRSNRHIYAQVIDDVAGRTMATASTLDSEAGSVEASSKRDAATAVGALVARRALDKGITQVVFDRAGYRYQGRVASLAAAAREAGLQF